MGDATGKTVKNVALEASEPERSLKQEESWIFLDSLACATLGGRAGQRPGEESSYKPVQVL